MSVLSICRSLRKVTDAELTELEEMARGQLAYLSPLKMATTARQHALGKHNMEVLARLRNLRDIILSAEKIARGK